MKTMKTTMITLAIMLMASFAYATGNVKLSMNPSEGENTYVEITNVALTQFEIDVKNEFGDVIFFKKTTEPTATYRKKYDFSMLDDGNYTFSVKSENELTQTRFSIKRGDLKVIDERKVVEPHFKFDGNIWKMSFLNYPMEKMNLYIYDSNQLIYEKKVDPVFAVHEGLDLSKLQPGEYQIVFTTGFDIFENEVRVK